MIGRLALRHLTLTPVRSAFLLFGYSMGVAVMIVLLSIGEALLSQSRDERLVGGGTITVLPEGVDVEVLKTGGLGGLFFSIEQSRFVYRQLLASPRLRDRIAAVAPQLDGKLLYVRTAGGVEQAVRAGGEIPSLSAAVGAPATVLAGSWTDDSLDRQWRAPTALELRNELDHFHLPPAAVRGNPSWAEWHYFNVLTPDRRQWAFISFIVAGAVGDAGGRWGGQVLVTVHEQGRAPRRFTSSAPARSVRFSTRDADVRIGDSRVSVRPDGRYAVHARAREEHGAATATLDLVVTPAPGAYFPPASFASGIVSGYVVPALRASATGRLCLERTCTAYSDVQSYHDHNWGVWRGVTWEWGAARAGAYTVLYGRVQPPDSVAAPPPLVVYLVDSLGFLAVFRPRQIHYTGGRVTRVNTRTIRTPTHAELVDVRGADTLRLRLDIEDATATDTRRADVERGDALTERRLPRPYFVQMKGTATIAGRVRGTPLAGRGAGFFETYR